MQDECVILREMESRNTGGEKILSHVADSVATICGLDMRSGDERHTAQYTTLIYDATLRLPIDTVIDAKDQVRITKCFGEALEQPLVYEIVGPVQRGPSGIRLRLKKVAL